MFKRRILFRDINKPSYQQQPRATPQPAPGYSIQRLPWGAPIWIFMHTLAAKLHPDKYLEIRSSLWSVICEICQNLPCPNCAEHATAYLKTIRIESLQTAEEFEHALIVFHNVVNSRKLVPLFPEENVHAIYSEKSWEQVVPAFMHVFQKSHGPMLQMFQNAHRRVILARIKDWFRAHRHYFD